MEASQDVPTSLSLPDGVANAAEHGSPTAPRRAIRSLRWQATSKARKT
jgi:hypothetical protein